jgi:hypothetical protein
MRMIATDPTHVAMHCHAADMNASAEAAHVRATTKSTHVAATAETSTVTTTTATSAAPCIGRADSQCGGKGGRGQDHHCSFHQGTPCI